MTIDLLFIGALAFGFIAGFRQGIINTVLSVLSFFIAILAAFKFSPALTRVLETSIGAYSPLMFIAGAFITFFISRWIIGTAAEALTGLMQVSHVNMINQMLGGGLLGFFFVFIFSVFVSFADSVQIIDNETKATSRTFVYLEPIRTQTLATVGGLKPFATDFFKEVGRAMDDMSNASKKPAYDSNSTIYNAPPEPQKQNPN